MPDWFTVRSVLPPRPLLSVIVPAAPPSEGSVMLLPLRSSVPPLCTSPPLPSDPELPSCNVPA